MVKKLTSKSVIGEVRETKNYSFQLFILFIELKEREYKQFC